MMLNKEESNYQDGYYSDGESNKFLSSTNNLVVRELKSNKSFMQNKSQRKNSLAMPDNQRFIDYNLLMSRSQEMASQLSSCVRVDRVENFMNINEGNSMPRERKLINKNV